MLGWEDQNCFLGGHTLPKNSLFFLPCMARHQCIACFQDAHSLSICNNQPCSIPFANSIYHPRLYNFVTTALHHPKQHPLISGASTAAASPFSSPPTLRDPSLDGTGTTTPSSLEALANYLNSPTQVCTCVND